MTYNPAGGKTYTLASSISSTATSITLSSFTLPVSGTLITMAVLNTDIAYGTIGPKTSSAEFISFTGITQNANGTATLTGVTRGLDKVSPFTTNATYKLPHSGQTLFILSDAPQVFNEYAAKRSDNTFTGLNLFSGIAPQTDTDPINPNDLTRLSYVQSLVLGTLTSIDVVVPGTAGETISDGNLIYLNTDNKWYKADADTASTVNNVLLGIAKGAGTANNQITNGILLQGVDNAQSGLTGGQIQYASNTAGAISSTPGTTEVTVGVAKSATELYFAPRFNQQLTENQQDAMDGANSPSASNVFLTNNDSSTTPSANKLVKYDANANLAATQIVVSYPLGESFTGATTPQPAVVIDDLLQPLFDGVSSFGAAASPQHAVKIIPRQTTTVSSIITMLTRVTDPGTNLSIEIQSDSSSAPSNTPITNGTSATIATSTLKNNEYRYFNFTFSTPPSLTAGTTYWIVFKTSATNANQISVPTLTNAKKYASFSGSTYNGSSWSANQPIPYFEMICATGGSKSLWVSDGNGVEPLGNYHGFCTTTGSAGATGTLIKQGVVGGLSSLAVGSDYYLSNTAGTLTLNKNEGVFVGTALSSTSILMPPIKTGFRNTNYYATILTSGEAGNAFTSVPYYAYEDGEFVITATATVKNSTRASVIFAVAVTHVNATSPSSIAIETVGYIQTYDNSADGPGTVTIPVKKGERIQASQGNAGGAGNTPSFSKIMFLPKV